MSWVDKIRNVAPGIARALAAAGVPGAAALSELSKVLLGKPDGTQDEIAERIANWKPEDELALRAAEQAFTVNLVDHAVQLEKLAADDRASARDLQKTQRSSTPSVLTYSGLGLLALSLAGLFFVPVPKENAPQVNAIVETLKLLNVTAFGFWLGGSFGSETKTAILGRMMEGKR